MLARTLAPSPLQDDSFELLVEATKLGFFVVQVLDELALVALGKEVL